MTTTARRVVVTVVSVMVLSIVAAAFVPVNLIARSGVSTESVQSGVWEREGEATRSTITVVATKGPANVRFALLLPEVMNERLVTSGQLPAADGSYRVTPDWPLTLEGVFGDVIVTSFATSAPVRVTRDDQKVRLVAEQSAALPSARQRYLMSTAMLWRSIPTGLDAGADLSVFVANRAVPVTDKSVVKWTETAPGALRTVFTGLGAFLLALALFAGLWVFGRALDTSKQTGARREVVRVATGAALTMLILNTLAYVMPLSVAGPLTLGTIVVITTVRWRHDRPPSVIASARCLAPLVGLASIPGLVAFFPVLLWGPSYSGEYKTDVAEYTTVASLVRDHSLFGLQSLELAQNNNAGLLAESAGFAWRSVDSVAIAAISMLGLPMIASLTVLYCLLFLLFSVGLLALRSITASDRRSMAVAVLALLAPAFSGLMVEGYLSQYFLLAFLPALLLAAWLALDINAQRQRWVIGFAGWALAAIIAVMGAAYPYFVAVIVIGILVAVLTDQSRRRAAFRLLPVLSAQVLVLMNLALLTVVNFADANQLQQRLTDITRYVLLNGFSASDKVLLFFGLEPYQWRWDGSAPTASMGFPGQWLWRLAATATGRNVWELLIVLGFVLITAAAIRWRSSLRLFPFLATLSMFVVWLLFSAVFSLRGDIYTGLKGLWTAAVIGAFIFATALWRQRLLPLLLVAICVMGVFWVRTAVADRTSWLIPRYSAADAPSHQAAQFDLAQVRAALESASSVAVMRGDQPLFRSDRDKVALAHTYIAVRDAGLDCPDCTFTRVPVELPCERGEGPAPEVIIAVGDTGRTQICGREMVFNGEVIDIYR